MSNKAISLIIKAFLALFVLLVGTLLWYYAIGRKPKLTLSAKLTQNDGTPSAHLLAPGEILLLVAAKATLYDMASGQQKWTTALSAAPAQPATPPVAAATPPPATPPPAPPAPIAAPAEKPDPLLAKRVDRRFAKLQTWAGKLAQKRATLKTPLQIEAFNVEAAKYHAELAEARAEAAPLHQAELARHAAAQAVQAATQPERLPGELSEAFSFGEWHEKTEVVAEGSAIWVVQGRRALALDRANGRTMKEVPLAGNFERVLRGRGCLYVITPTPDGARHVTRIATADGAAQTIAAGPAALPRYGYAEAGVPAAPNLQPERTEFSAAGSELLQVDIRLVEQKITERQIISGDAVSDMEEADKKTVGGWASDAAVIAQTLAKDAARDASGGGKERIDESTYEITLRPPFAADSPASAPVRVQGRPEVFSTATLDLVVAGQTLLAFDRANKKLWESKLAHPLAFPDALADGDAAGTLSQPCLEDAERLYLFDKGFLSAFESKTGKPLWRLPSIGIRKVQLDGRGTLYVSSANGSAESLKYAALEMAEPLTFKVDAKTGKIRWKLEKYQDCFVSGGDLYATRETRNAEDAVNQVFDRSKAPQCRFKLYKLSTRDGEPQWEWFQTRRPLRIESEGKKVSLLFADELQVIKSIAL